MKPDFSGYATKAGLKCSDGRTIMPDAFKHQDQVTVPLVWQHGHREPANVLGHAILEHREDGVYAYGFFNTTPQGVNSKMLVEHKDITALSIYANQLVEKSKLVLHGVIREVSLVLSGANPGAVIDNISVSHSDGEVEELDDEAIIYTGLELQHEDIPSEEIEEIPLEADPEEEVEHSAEDPTVQEIYDSLTDDQKNVVHYMIGAALEAADTAAQHSYQEGYEDMRRNVFESNNNEPDEKSQALTHDAMKGIVADAAKMGSLKEAVEAYALAHGIDDIDVLFPDARTLDNTPEWQQRRTEWVAGVLNGTRHTPFSRIKTRSADLTLDEARAKGYITGTMKKEEFFGVTQRTTSPTTIYKKQKLDRDDILDITDFDVVAWMKAEMRLMLEEEVARAVLIGDGRDVADEDKVKDPGGASEGAGIRSIINDHELYVTRTHVNVNDSGSSYVEVIESVARARKFYKGTGTPTFYTTATTHTEMLLVKDTLGRRLYTDDQDLASALRVGSIVDVEVMEDEPTVLGIIVNLSDYVIGSDAGGDVSMFDDFDIDYNQFKYLIETRLSGALVKIKSAIVVYKTAAGDTEVTAVNPPTFVPATGVVTIVPTANIAYKDAVTGATLTGAQPALTEGETLHVEATATAGHYLANSDQYNWAFTRPRT